MKNIPLDARVECVDGECGKSVTVVLNPTTGEIIYVVVEVKKGDKPGQYMVPVERVAGTAPARIQLACTGEELTAMESFIETQYVESSPTLVSTPAQPDGYYMPYVTVGGTEIPVEVERLARGERAVRRGTRVEATDGYVGTIGELVVDPDSGAITHFVLKESNLWGKKELTLPLSAMDYSMADTVYLKLDKAAIEKLPTIPLKRNYAEGQTRIELMARVFDSPGGAAKALDFVEDLRRRRVLKLLNAAVLVKDKDGDFSVKDTRDIDPKKGRWLGAITGGLIGLIGGPAGVVLGALTGLGAGGLAGKKIDFGFSDKFLKGLEEHMQPDSSALIVLVEHEWASELSMQLGDLEGAVFQQTLTDELVEQLMAATEEG